MPLHYAAASGAPFEVTKLLLECNPEATTAKDKARRAEPTFATPRVVVAVLSLY